MATGTTLSHTRVSLGKGHPEPVAFKQRDIRGRSCIGVDR